MPRKARCYNAGEYYHVIVRGINKQDIFRDEKDRRRFLETMQRFSAETDVSVIAWCLMSNHVHLLIKADGMPDLFMKKLGCSYVPYFNRKYERVGHLFQDRYKSETIRDEKYMLEVVRYIHMNPEKAHICKMIDYKWSSYSEFLDESRSAEKDLILGMLGGPEGYIQFMEAADPAEYMDDQYGLTDREALDKFSGLFPGGAGDIQRLPRSKRYESIVKLSEAGLKPSQICRVTGLGKTVVYNVLK